MLGSFGEDLRHTIRSFRASPGFVLAAILSLSLGIGANTAIFSLIDSLMLKTLPVSRPEELLQVTMDSRPFFSNPIWEQIRDRQDTFSSVFAYGRWRFNLAAGGEARYVNGLLASGRYFDTLSVRPALGRTLTPNDDLRGCAGAAVLSHRFWQTEYAGRVDVLGKTIVLDSHPVEIVGVTEPRFTGLDVGSSFDVIVPLCAEQRIHRETSSLDINAAPGNYNSLFAWLRVVGRPKLDLSTDQVSTRLRSMAPEVYRATLPSHWRADEQARYLSRSLDIQPVPNGFSYLREQYSEPLVLLMGLVGIILLISCANVANLLLARSEARQHEVAMRLALGAGRGRLIRQLLSESLLLSMAGAALGVLLAHGATSWLVQILDVSLDVTPNLRVLAFTAITAIITTLLVGLVPAWRTVRIHPYASIRTSGRGAIGHSGLGLGKALVVVQIALSLVLLVGAGLLLTTFWKLASLDAGFDRAHVLLAEVDLCNGRFAPERRRAAFDEMLASVRAVPGVRSASVSDVTPICGCAAMTELSIEGSGVSAAVHHNRVSDGYFETLGTALIAGRDFQRYDAPGSAMVAIINQTFAERYFGGVNPLGRQYRVRKGNAQGEPVEIIGVAKDAKYGSLREEVPPTVYTAWNQDATPGSQTTFELRAAGGGPGALIPAVKAAFGQVNGDVSLEFTTLAAKVDHSVSRERILAVLSGFFGGLALLLASIGLYGVMSYNVARRRSEIGIRMALGAEQAGVLKMVLGEVARLVGYGLVIGLGVTMATTRFVASLLYGLAPSDPATFALAAAALAAVAMLAGYLPARRAAHVDPIVALREE